MPLDGVAFSRMVDYNGVAFSIELLEWGLIFSGYFGVRIFWQVASLGIKKYRTICDTKMGVKYVFYIHFNKCVNPF